MADLEQSRRRFVALAAAAGGGLILSSARGADEKKPEEQQGEEDVAPAEDLMREHGVLKRVMLVYDEVVRRIRHGGDVPPETVSESAKIIRNFIEDYHEKLEENYLFPRFEKANKLVDLTRTLREQHQAGRRVTDIILANASASALKNADDRAKLVHAIEQFNRMYAPHEAREDTVLFPALHEIIPHNEYDALGEDFEKKEHQLFGEDGFEKMVDKVAGIEKTLGIYELSQFTPKV